MKIVYLNPTGQLGGAERSLLDILAVLRQTKPDWPLELVSGTDGPLLSRAERLGVRSKLLPFPQAFARLGEFGISNGSGKARAQLSLLLKLGGSLPAIASYVHRLKKYLQTLAPGLIHTNGFKMHLLGLWARPKGVPVIWHIHDYVTPRPLTSRLLQLSARQCAAIITNSRSVAEDFESLSARNGDIRTIYNAVDLNNFSPDGPVLDLDALSGLDPAKTGTIRVGLLATFARWKGHEVFLKALSLLPKELPIRAYIIGRPLYLTDNSQYRLEELQDLAAHFGVSQRLGFAGFVENPAAAIRALDIVVHASTRPEPFGLVIVEAMACGKAVIVSEAGGAQEIIEAGINALGYPPGDARALAQRIEELAMNPGLRQRLVTQGRRTVEERFNYSCLTQELIPLYQRVISAAN